MLGQYAVVKAMETILSKPDSAFSVRGLGKASGLSPGAARIALEFMKEKGIVKLKVVGKTFQYSANLESVLCRQWKILFNLDFLESEKLVERIAQKIPKAKAILLYGSFAKGTNSEKSDIDLLVIQQSSEKQRGLPSVKGFEANITIMSVEEWRQKSKTDKAFYDNVIFDSIVLFGERPVVF